MGFLLRQGAWTAPEIQLLAERYLLLERVDGAPASGGVEAPRRCIDTVTEETLVCRQVSLRCNRTAQLMEAHRRLADYSDRVTCISRVIRVTPESSSDAGADEQLYLLSPASYGDLHSYLRSKRRLREPEARALFRQAAEAVHHCHSHGVVLTDLKLRRFVFADPQRYHHHFIHHYRLIFFLSILLLLLPPQLGTYQVSRSILDTRLAIHLSEPFLSMRNPTLILTPSFLMRQLFFLRVSLRNTDVPLRAPKARLFRLNRQRLRGCEKIAMTGSRPVTLSVMKGRRNTVEKRSRSRKTQKSQRICELSLGNLLSDYQRPMTRSANKPP